MPSRHFTIGEQNAAAEAFASQATDMQSAEITQAAQLHPDDGTSREREGYKYYTRAQRDEITKGAAAAHELIRQTAASTSNSDGSVNKGSDDIAEVVGAGIQTTYEQEHMSAEEALAGARKALDDAQKRTPWLRNNGRG